MCRPRSGSLASPSYRPSLASDEDPGMSTTVKNVIVGTAGHIDHGKSALVEALTGTHPDRLEEEKRRGITIDLGFAFLESDIIRIGLVDLPGEARFLLFTFCVGGG